MLILSIYSFLLFLISSFLMILANLISKKSFKDREKNSPFECGFDPKNSARLPFSLQFFLIAMIFIIFDVEITLILPFIYMYKLLNMFYISYFSLFFLSILIFGVYHEWKQGALEWQI